MSMGRKNRGVTESLRDKRIKEFERGLTTGKYTPYIRTQDLSSKGIRGRIADPVKQGKIYHCLSLNETFKLIDLLRRPDIVDIKEQYAYTNLEKSRAFAKRLEIHHPRYKWSSLDTVITFDFFCKLETHKHLVISVKPEDQLENERTQQKILLEKAICESEHYEYELVLDCDVKTEETRNLIRVIRGAKLNEKLNAVYPQWLVEFSCSLLTQQNEPLSNSLKQIAAKQNLSFKESFTLMQHAFWIGHIKSDPEIPLLPEFTPYQLGVESYV